MAKKIHLGEVLQAKHKDSGALEGGACLKGDCVGTYKEDKSCSYRWEVVHACRGGEYVGLGRKQHYVTPKGVTGRVRTMRYQTKGSKGSSKPKFSPAKYPSSLPAPDAANKDWDIDGPTTSYKITQKIGGKTVVFDTVKKDENFESVTRPWWNNAHHMIPKATLRGRINAMNNPAGWKGPATLRRVIACFLLKAQYNVNHYRNMIILPMDAEVGRLIGLPRHLVLEDKPAALKSGDKKTKFDHEKYGDLVWSELDPIMDEFTKGAKKADKGDCVTKEVNGSKEKLEELSDRCYRGITTGVKKGDPISLLKAIPV
jgi:hypothetical protein